MLESGECACITKLAAAERINRSYLCRVLRLTLLAPKIVEAVMDGRQPEGMMLPALMKEFPVKWGEQWSGYRTAETTALPGKRWAALNAWTTTTG